MTGGAAFWGVAVFLALLHFALRVGFGVGEWSPDLLAVGLLVAALRLPVAMAAGLGLAFGVIEDALSILSFGANAMALTIVGILGSWSREFFVGGSVVFLVSYFTIGVWFRGVLHWVISGRSVGEETVRLLLLDMPLAALYGAGVGTLLLVLVGILGDSGYGEGNGNAVKIGRGA